MIDRISAMPTLPSPGQVSESAQGASKTDSLREAAKEFEAVFLAEMFSHAGLGAARKTGGGGAGEEAFSSLLAQEWAGAVAEKGGIGLAEQIFRALEAREGKS